MRVRLLASYCASCGVSLVAAEQTAPDPKAEPALPAIFAPRAASEAKDTKAEGKPRPGAAASPRGSAISAEMAKKLSSVVTRAAPPAAGDGTNGAGTPGAGGSSDAVKLEPYVVREDKLPKMKDREMLTPKGMLELARRLHPGVLRDSDAMILLGEDFARERRQEMIELKGILESGGAKIAPDVKRKIDEMINQPIDLPKDFSPPSRLPR